MLQCKTGCDFTVNVIRGGVVVDSTTRHNLITDFGLAHMGDFAEARLCLGTGSTPAERTDTSLEAENYYYHDSDVSIDTITSNHSGGYTETADSLTIYTHNTFLIHPLNFTGTVRELGLTTYDQHPAVLNRAVLDADVVVATDDTLEIVVRYSTTYPKNFSSTVTYADGIYDRTDITLQGKLFMFTTQDAPHDVQLHPRFKILDMGYVTNPDSYYIPKRISTFYPFNNRRFSHTVSDTHTFIVRIASIDDTPYAGFHIQFAPYFVSSSMRIGYVIVLPDNAAQLAFQKDTAMSVSITIDYTGV